MNVIDDNYLIRFKKLAHVFSNGERGERLHKAFLDLAVAIVEELPPSTPENPAKGMILENLLVLRNASLALKYNTIFPPDSTN